MTTPDTEALRRVAEAAVKSYRDDAPDKAAAIDFDVTFDPPTVLALLDERDAAANRISELEARVGVLEGAWRPEVRAFADLMEAKLRANDHKPGWKADDPEALLRRLAQEHDELGDAVRWHKNYDTSDRGGRLGPVHRAGVIGAEAADVANFAMMIADVCGALTPQEKDQGR